MTTTQQLLAAIVLTLTLIAVLASDAWAFLTPEERGRVLWWMFMSTSIPDWIIHTDLYAELFARYVYKNFSAFEREGLPRMNPVNPLFILIGIVVASLVIACIVTAATGKHKKKAKCCCFEFEGDNINCPFHGV
jgi:hypothetical protein